MPSKRNNKYLYVNRRRVGIGDYLYSASIAWRYAKKHNRTLVLAWSDFPYLIPAQYPSIRHYLFKFSKEFTTNGFSHFLDMPDQVEGVRILRPKVLPLWVVILFRIIHFKMTMIQNKIPFQWLKNYELRQVKKRHDSYVELKNKNSKYLFMLGNLAGDHLASELTPFFNSIHLAPRLRSIADTFFYKSFADKKVVGVHIRYFPPSLPKSAHTPYWVDEEKAKNEIKLKVEKTFKKLGEEISLLLCTDSDSIQRWFIEEFPQTRYYTRLPEWKDKSDEQSKELYTSMPDDTFVEMFLLTMCDGLIMYPKSGFAYLASLRVPVID